MAIYRARAFLSIWTTRSRSSMYCTFLQSSPLRRGFCSSAALSKFGVSFFFSSFERLNFQKQTAVSSLVCIASDTGILLDDDNRCYIQAL